MKSTLILGIPRLTGQCSQPFPGFDAHAARLQAEDICHFQVSAWSAEMDSFDRSGQETIRTGPYGALPILIFSQDPAKTQVGMTALMASDWNQVQEDLKNLSTHSRRIVAKEMCIRDSPKDYQNLHDFYQKVATADQQQLVLTRAPVAKGN